MAELSGKAQESSVRLKDRNGWPAWFAQYKAQCDAQGIWETLNPDSPDSPNPMRSMPEPPPTLIELMQQLDLERESARELRASQDTTNASSSSSTMDSSSTNSRVPKATLEDVEKRHQILSRDYQLRNTYWANTSGRYKAVWSWALSSVDKKLLEPIQISLGSEITLQKLVRALRAQLAPSSTTTENTVRQEYRNALAKARSGRVNPQTWYQEWMTALARARAYKIPDVEGSLAVRDFLDAVSEKLAPDWGRSQLVQIIGDDELGNPSKTLDQYGNWFSALAHESSSRSNSKAPAIFATLGSGPSTGTGHSCPCNPNQSHKWTPENCWVLQLAITGATEKEMQRQPTQDRLKRIRETYAQDQFKNLRQELEKKGWEQVTSSTNGKAGSSKKSSGYPGSINAALIDPKLLDESFGIYATGMGTPHHLSRSTLLDNCGAMHLVNSKDLLVPGSFVPNQGNIVESGISSILIEGYGSRIMRKTLDGARGPGTEDLVLSRVALVKGFHVNIVSEALLLKQSVWYSGYDCSLNYGEPGDSVMVKKLERRFQLVFIEYKPLNSCSPAPQSLTLLCATLKSPRPHCPTRDTPKPREDSEHLWHLRAGHLGPRALKALVYNARNVRISGTKRIDCEHCSVTHAKQVISRKASERSSPRPFWRVLWDLFDFNEGYDGSLWLIVIKDEYSGKLFGHLLKSKALLGIHGVIREFDSWVKRQYGLSICVLKHDNDTSVIAIQGSTVYERWAKEEGIVLELSPTYTHESNGAPERAGQEVITKSIKMSLGANLPERLWPEATRAAIYLYNISPLEARQMRSPNEVLYSWFRTYFRWYAPQLVYNHLADLKPDWDGIYAYGARAYPLMKAREAGKDKRAFKTSPRGHVGYLVGYISSNIYRIWVPKLDRVIITRNVTFDETRSYSEETDPLEGNTEPLNSVLELIELREDESREAAATLESVMDLEDDPLDTIVVQLPKSSGEQLQTSGVEDSGKDVELGLLTPERTPEPLAQGNIETRAHIEEAETANSDRTKLARDLRTPLVAGQGYDTTREPVSGSQEPVVTALRSSRRTTRLNSEALRALPTQPPEPKPVRKSTRESKPSAKKAAASFAVFKELVKGTERIESFLNTYLPDQLEGIDESSDHQTMHAVIAAALQSEVKRPAITPAEHQSDLPKAPKFWRDLENHRYGAQFKADAELELSNLKARDCWRVIPVTKDTGKLLPLKWVFSYKVTSAGLLQRCRSRIVARGDQQDEETILSTYAATLAARSFRLGMALAARFDLEIAQYDVINAFINAQRGSKSSPLYCQLPDGFKEPGKCAEINRALYGLRDSPALWFEELCGTLTGLGLTQCKEDHCIFVDEHRKVIVLFFVDDILLLYHLDNADEAQRIVAGVKRAYELREMGEAKWFLGIRITRNKELGTLTLTHDTYIEKIAHKFGLTDGSSPSTPLPILELLKNKGQAPPSQVKEFQEKVGSILYTAIMIRADAAFAASQLSHHLLNPSPELMAAVNWCIRYLFGTRFLGIIYRKELTEAQLMIASDASYADDPETRRSSQGYTISLFGGLIAWKATRQATVTTSTTEAELKGVSETAKEALALKRLFAELQLELGEPWKIFCDNQQTIRLVIGENERISTKLRHIDIQNMWLRQEHQAGKFELVYLPTNDMPADGLTKNLPRYKFERFKALLNLYDAREDLGKLTQEE